MRGLSLSPVQGTRLSGAHDIENKSPNRLFEELNLSPRSLQHSQLSDARDILSESIKRFLEMLNTSFFEELQSICPGFISKNNPEEVKQVSQLFLSTVIALQNFKDHYLI